MGHLLKSVALIGIIHWFNLSCFAQEKTSPNISLRAGAGNSISMKHFSQEETSFNIPSSSFINVGLSTNLIERNNKSLFVGLEAQALDYYPSLSEKADLTYASLLIGRTRRFDIAQGLYL